MVCLMSRMSLVFWQRLNNHGVKWTWESCNIRRTAKHLHWDVWYESFLPFVYLDTITSPYSDANVTVEQNSISITWYLSLFCLTPVFLPSITALCISFPLLPTGNTQSYLMFLEYSLHLSTSMHLSYSFTEIPLQGSSQMSSQMILTPFLISPVRNADCFLYPPTALCNFLLAQGICCSDHVLVFWLRQM